VGTNPAGQGTDTGEKLRRARNPNPAAERDRKLSQLSRSIKKAYSAFQYAALKMEKRLEDLNDSDAHKFLKESGFADDNGDLMGLADYKLPELPTFTRYIRQARKALGEQKYNSRAGRPTGKSVARQHQVEHREGED
jgi:hypothetical protein